MPKKKRNHFISQGLIHFWARPNGQVFYWDKETSPSLELRNPKSVHYRDFLYARWDVEGKRDMTAEDALKREIDDHAPDLIRRIVSSFPDLVPLSMRDRELLMKLVVRTVLRHPTIIGWANSNWRVRVATQLNRLSRWIGRKGPKDAAYSRYGREKVLAGEVYHLAATGDISNIIDYFGEQTLGILVSENDASNLVLGSQPFLLNPNGASHDLRIGLVVHPRILVGIFPEQGDDFVKFLTKDDVHRINGMLIRQSPQVVMTNGNDAHGAWYDVFDEKGGSERHHIEVRDAEN